MTEERNPNRLYPSSAAFMVGPMVASSKNGSCHRFLWTENQIGNYDKKIADEYQALGALDEFRYSQLLDSRKVPYKREVQVTKDYNGSTISGRIDFILHPDTDAPIYVEKKSTTSKSVLKDVIKANKPDPNHLAQIVTYMMLTNVYHGLIVVSYYELDGALMGYHVTDEAEFRIECKGVDIYVNDVLHERSTKDLARWYQFASDALKDKERIPVVNHQVTDKFKSICRFCPLKEKCADLQIKMTDAKGFLQSAEEVLKNLPEGKKFTIQQPPKRARRKNEKTRPDSDE